MNAIETDAPSKDLERRNTNAGEDRNDFDSTALLKAKILICRMILRKWIS